MAEQVEKKKNRFISVDVWRGVFGEVSVKAIYEIYRSITKCSPKELGATNFKYIVEFLRKQDKPSYTIKAIQYKRGFNV